MWPAFLFPVDLAFAERKEKSTPHATLASTESLFLVSALACKWQQLNSPETCAESKTPIAPSLIRTLQIRLFHYSKSSAAYVTKAQVCGWEPGPQKLFRARSPKRSSYAVTLILSVANIIPNFRVNPTSPIPFSGNSFHLHLPIRQEAGNQTPT